MTLRQRWKQTTLANKLAVISGVLVAFSTVFYTLTAIGQYYLLSESAAADAENSATVIAAVTEIARASGEANRQSAESARDALAAASKALDAQIELSRSEQRAWVTVDSASVGGVIAGSRLSGRLSISNSGRSPAMGLSGPQRIAFWREAVLPEFMLKREGAVVAGPTVLGPGGALAISSSLGRGITQQEIDELLQGTAFLFIYGQVNYQDVFGAPHWTRYCFRNVPPTEGKPVTTSSGEWIVNACAYWNDLR